MAKRITAGAATRDEVNRQLYELGRVEIELRKLEVARDAHVDEIRMRYASDLERLVAKHRRIELELRALVEDNRRMLLPGRRKTLSLPLGKVAFRAQPPKVQLAGPGWTWGLVLDALRAKLSRFVRTVEEVDKAAIIAAARDNDLGPDELKPVGLVVEPEREAFYAAPDHESVLEEMRRAR